MVMKTPSHPGRILKNTYFEAIKKAGGNRNLMVKMLDISSEHLSRILNCHTNITPEMAIKISKVFGGTPQFWLNLQQNYDIRKAEETIKLSEEKLLASHKQYLKLEKLAYS